MERNAIRGVVPPLVTPVDDVERVDVPALRRIIRYVIRGGVHGVFVLGSTGEFFGLEEDQQRLAVETTVDEVSGRVPVFAGIGAVTTRGCVKAARMAEKAGAQAVTLLPPAYLSPNDDELFDHFRAVADAVSIPLLAYNNPDRIRVNLSASLVERLAALPNVVGVKDSSGDMTLTAEYLRRTRGTGFRVMAGRDTMILATLAYGGAGCVAATANVAPEFVVRIYDRFQVGDLAGALQAQFDLAPLRLAFSLGSWPVAMKDAMNLMGIAAGAPIRPNRSCSEANLGRLRQILCDLGLMAPDATEGA